MVMAVLTLIEGAEGVEGVESSRKKIVLFDPPALDVVKDAMVGFTIVVEQSDCPSHLPVCQAIYTLRNPEGTFSGTHKSVKNCSFYNKLGVNVTTYAQMVDGESYYAVPYSHHFVYPATVIGERITLPHVTNGDGEAIELETLTTRPRLFRLHNFVSADEVDQMIASANGLGYERSTGGLATLEGAGKENQGTFTSRRTSENAWDLGSPIAYTLKQRSYKALNLVHNPKSEDGFQVVRYQPGQFYMSHTDFFDIGEDQYWNFDPVNGGSNRFATVFLYLSDAELGGETVFPQADRAPNPTTKEEDDAAALATMELFVNNSMARDFVQECRSHYRVYPKKGDAVVFYHQDRIGKLDPTAIHGACPVLKGKKWGANLWIWNDRVYDLDEVERNKPPEAKDPRAMNIPVVFQNPLTHTVKLYWIDHDKSHLFQGIIRSRDQLELNSYHAHKFVVKLEDSTEEQGTIIDTITIDHTRRTMIISDQSQQPQPPAPDQGSGHNEF